MSCSCGVHYVKKSIKEEYIMKPSFKDIFGTVVKEKDLLDFGYDVYHLASRYTTRCGLSLEKRRYVVVTTKLSKNSKPCKKCLTLNDRGTNQDG